MSSDGKLHGYKLRYGEDSVTRAVRLKAEGGQKRFEAFRDCKAAFVVAGQTKREADWLAWEQFKPPDAVESPLPEPPAAAPKPKKPKPKPADEPVAPAAGEERQDPGKMLFDAYFWAFMNMDAAKTEDYTGPAPPGAKPLLEEAKKDRQWFYRECGSKLLPPKSHLETIGRFVDDNRDLSDRLDAIESQPAELQAGPETGESVLLGSPQVAP